MTDAQVRIGIVGGGSMGALHARAVSTNPETTLVWLADPDERARELADRYATSWHPQLDLSTVDAVIVAAPTNLHYEIALPIIEQGVPLLLEKPVSDDWNRTVEIVDLASANTSILMCGLLERFNPAVRTAQDICRAPRHISTVRHSPYAERIRTGVAGDLLIHDIDLVLRLIGDDPVAASCAYGYFEPRSAEGSEDVADANLRFDGGEVASLSASRIAQRKVRSMTITELGRVIEVDLLRQDITVYRSATASEFEMDGGYTQQTVMDIPVIRHVGEPLQLQLQHFVQLIRGQADPAVELRGILGPHAVLNAFNHGAGGR